MSQTRAQLEAWRQQNPGLFRGLQQALSRAEGTWRENQPGYRTLFGGGQVEDTSRHPDRVIRSPGGYASAAAGAYQFLPGTYQEAAQALGLKGFDPGSQDLAMLYKVRERLMPVGGLAALTKEGTLSPRLQAYLAPEWASLPTETGKSYYGQPVKPASQVQSWFEEGARGAQAATSTPATPQQTTQKDSGLGQVLLNKFINMLGTMGGRRSSLDAPQMPDYSEGGSSASSDELRVVLGALEDQRNRQELQNTMEQQTARQLQSDVAVAEAAKAQLLAEALGAFSTPSSVI